jgi:hypothetical protein
LLLVTHDITVDIIISLQYQSDNTKSGTLRCTIMKMFLYLRR